MTKLTSFIFVELPKRSNHFSTTLPFIHNASFSSITGITSNGMVDEQRAKRYEQRGYRVV